MTRLSALTLPVVLTMLMSVAGWAAHDAKAQQPTAPTFHHLHLNSVDPPAAISFYTRTFENAKPISLAGWNGVQSEGTYFLFNRVSSPPPSLIESAIWHFGWGSPSMEADYQKHLTNGVTFATPLTRLSASLLFAYIKAPDGALVEINTSSTNAFIHTHLVSAAPLCAADWYVKHLGATTRAQRTGPCEVPFAAPSEPLGVIRSPSTSVRFADISLIIYPQQRPVRLISPRGRVIDHIAFSVTDLKGTLDALRGAGVTVLENIHPFGNTRSTAAMIEGPDAIAIELIDRIPSGR